MTLLGRRFISWIGWPILICITLRLVWIFLNPPSAERELGPLSDAGDYHTLAVSLLHEHGFLNQHGMPTAFRPPVYPVFLAIAYTFAGIGNLLAVVFVQAALAGLNAFLAGRISNRLFNTNLAAWLYAFYPAFIPQVAQILTEELGRTLLLSSILLLLISMQRTSLLPPILAGLVLAFAVLNKSVLAAALPFVAIALLLCGSGSFTQRFARTTLLTIACSLPLLGWMWRNHQVSSELIPVSTNFPITFAHGQSRFSFYTNEWYPEHQAQLYVPEDYRNLTQLRAYKSIAEELSTGAKWSALAREKIAQHPQFYAVLTVRKTLHYWGFSIRNSRVVRFVAAASMLPVLLLGWWGILRALRTGGMHRQFAWLGLAIALPTCIPYIISQPDVRYRLALVDPIWIIWTSGMVVYLYSRLTKSTQASE